MVNHSIVEQANTTTVVRILCQKN